ncbi:MAG: hypothetical protein PSV46_23985 [Reyranella sp.]|nr:hypothetical protein [Reyranella sp.]
MNRFPCLLLLLAATLAPTSGARAAGGAHIVDDSEVETPGTCHLETWITRFVPGDGYLNLGPACTSTLMPRIEMGATYQHYWDQVINAPLLGPTFKFNFFPESTGVGLGLGLNAGMNLTTGTVGIASLIMLVTIPLDERVKINVNGGWNYLSNFPSQNSAFYGIQVESKVAWDVSLMLEYFGREPGITGAQIGLRYTPNDSWFDFDFLAGNIFDGTSAKFFTVGVTVRF